MNSWESWSELLKCYFFSKKKLRILRKIKFQTGNFSERSVFTASRTKKMNWSMYIAYLLCLLCIYFNICLLCMYLLLVYYVYIVFHMYFVLLVYSFLLCLEIMEKCNMEAFFRLLECFWKTFVMKPCKLGLNAWFPGFSLVLGEMVKIDLFLEIFFWFTMWSEILRILPASLISKKIIISWSIPNGFQFR